MSKKFEELIPIFGQILQQKNTGNNVWAGESKEHDTRRFLGSKELSRNKLCI
jgi:hypothetical protein